MKIILIITAILTLSSCGFEVVDPGYRGIETNLGKVVGEPLAEGLHFYNPFTSDVKEFNVRQETWTSKTAVGTKDNQTVHVEFTVTYNPDPKMITRIYLEYGSEDQLIEKIVKPIVLGSIKNAIGLVGADDLIAKRESVTKAALLEVSENIIARHVITTDLQFTNIDFNDAYERAIEAKVVATQEAQKAKNDTIKIEEQAKQTVLTAQAQAESMRIQSAALAQNKGLVEYEIAKKWNGVLPVYMMGNTVPMLNLNGLTK